MSALFKFIKPGFANSSRQEAKGAFSVTHRLYAASRSFSSDTPGSEDVQVKIEGGIRNIIFNRPEKKNAMTVPMARTITTALIESNNDDNTNIVVISAVGDFFTSGADLSGFTAPKKNNDNTAKENIVPQGPPKSPAPNRNAPAVATFGNSIIDCKKPLIALVNGPAVGFGVTMLGLFDAVYCSTKATFHTRFTEYGLPPEFCSTYTFPKIMGYAKASRILMFNTKISGAEAYEYGLVSKIFDDSEFKSESWKAVQNIANLPSKALINSKALIRGREREFLRQIFAAEQQKFDVELAREVKRKFALKQKDA